MQLYCATVALIVISITDCCVCALGQSAEICYNQHVHYPILCFLLTNQSAVLLGQNVSICCVRACCVCVWASVCTCVYKCPLWSQGFLCVCECVCVWHVRGNPWKVKLTTNVGGTREEEGQDSVLEERRGGEVCSRGQSFRYVTQCLASPCSRICKTKQDF